MLDCAAGQHFISLLLRTQRFEHDLRLPNCAVEILQVVENIRSSTMLKLSPSLICDFAVDSYKTFCFRLQTLRS
jgi:hypothetical protein